MWKRPNEMLRELVSRPEEVPSEAGLFLAIRHLAVGLRMLYDMGVLVSIHPGLCVDDPGEEYAALVKNVSDRLEAEYPHLWEVWVLSMYLDEAIPSDMGLEVQLGGGGGPGGLLGLLRELLGDEDEPWKEGSS